MMKDILSKLMFSIVKSYMNFIMIYYLPERMKIEKDCYSKSLLLTYMIKLTMLFTLKI